MVRGCWACPAVSDESNPLMKLDAYVTALHALKEDDRLRGLKPRTGVDFASNDYLALASAPRMNLAALEAGTPIGAGGSRLLRGNCEEHESLQAEAVRFFGARTALFFGYVANFAHLTTLPQRGDLLGVSGARKCS